MSYPHPILADPTLTLADIMRRWPATGPALLGPGLTCMGCVMTRFCTIDAAAEAHGVDAGLLRQTLLAAVSGGRARRSAPARGGCTR